MKNQIIKSQIEKKFVEENDKEENVWLAFPVKEQIRICEMYSLFQRHHEYDYEFPGETHNFWECVYVLKGELCASADERVYNIAQGDMIFHKPMEAHKFIVNSEEGADLLIFAFAAEGPMTTWLRNKVFRLSDSQRTVIDSLMTFAESKVSCSTEQCQGDRVTNRQETKQGELSGKEQNYQDEHHFLKAFDRIPHYSQMVTTYLQHLFLDLADESTVVSVSTAADAACFSRAISYLNSNLHNQPSVAEIARFSGVSETGLKRIFEKYAGISVHKYFLKLKIKAAVALLQDGETVSLVAERTGFTSQSYFSKAFKRETGVNPSEYKKNLAD